MAEHRSTIDIAAPPQVVFPYLVTDEGMAAWMGERATLDPVPGGMFAAEIAGEDGQIVEIRLTFDRLGYAPPTTQPA